MVKLDLHDLTFRSTLFLPLSPATCGFSADAVAEQSTRLADSEDVIEIVGGTPGRGSSFRRVAENISQENSHRSRTEHIDGAEIQETQGRQTGEQKGVATEAENISVEAHVLAGDPQAEAGGELPRNAADEETHKCAISTEDPVDPLLGNREGHTVSENVQMSPGNAQASVRTQSESSSRAGSRRSERKGKDGEDATQKPLDRSGDTGKSSESGRVPQRGNEDKNGPSGGGGIASAADASALGDVYAESESFRVSLGEHQLLGCR